MKPTAQGVPQESGEKGTSGLQPFGGSPRETLQQKSVAERLKVLASEALLASTENQPFSFYNKTLTENLGLEKLQAEQDLRRQIIRFRHILFYFLLILMTVETLALFVIIVLASLPSPLLQMDKLTLQVLVGATIAQISAMLIVIIRSVYPDSLNKLITPDKGRGAAR